MPQYRWSLSLATIIILATAILYTSKLNSFQVGVYMDDAEYVVLAESIAEGPAYGLVNDEAEVAPTRYPFGWPLLLAPIYYVSAGDIGALKLVSLCLTMLNIAIICFGWKWLGFGKPWIGICTAAVYAFLPLTVGHAVMLMSEPAFLTCVLAGLGLTYYLGTNRRSGILTALVLGIAWLFIVYVRTIGIVFVLGCLVFLLWHRRWQTIVVSLVGMATILMVIVVATPINPTNVVDTSLYGSQLTNPSLWDREKEKDDSVITRLESGINQYLLEFIPNSVVPFVSQPKFSSIANRLGLGWAPIVVSIIVVTAMAGGFLFSLAKYGLHPSHLSILLYLGILFVWPWRGERFVYGVMPYLIAYLLISGEQICEFLSDRSQMSAKWIPSALIACIAVWISTGTMLSILADDSLDHTLDLRVGTSWIAENTPLNSVVFTDHPISAHLYTQRSTANFSNLDSLIASSCIRPTYVLVSPTVEWSNPRSLRLSPGALQIEKELRGSSSQVGLRFNDNSSEVTVYEINCNK